MSLEVKVPVVGESITEVTIAKWLKKDGDQVAMDEIICELESDKATFELPAEAAGILRIVAQEGDTVEIGGVLCRIEGDGAASSAAPAASQAPTETKTISDPQSTPVAEATPTTGAQNQPQTPASAPATGGGVKEIKIPTVGESITEVTISKWMKNDGDQVAMDEVLCELESDKATFELPAEAAGILRIVAPEGSTIEIGAVICKIEVNGAQTASPQATPAPSAAGAQAMQAQTSGATSGASTYASGTPSPAAGKILSEKGINAADVQGSGRDGRITKEDAMGAQAKPAQAAPAAAAKPATTSAPAAAPTAAAGARNQRREKMSSLRKTV